MIRISQVHSDVVYCFQMNVFLRCLLMIFLKSGEQWLSEPIRSKFARLLLQNTFKNKSWTLNCYVVLYPKFPIEKDKTKWIDFNYLKRDFCWFILIHIYSEPKLLTLFWFGKRSMDYQQNQSLSM